MDTPILKYQLELYEKGLATCESPIEEELYMALRRILPNDLKILVQKKIGRYRADLCIDTDKTKLVIECDGKKYHQDYKREAIRDDYIVGKGYAIVHYKGEDIMRSPLRTALDACGYISEAINSDFYNYLLTDNGDNYMATLDNHRYQRYKTMQKYPNSFPEFTKKL